jgi:hypothetical protein
MAAYRATPHSATGYTPNFLMMGREVRAPIDIVLSEPGDQSNHEHTNYEDFNQKRATIMRQAYSLARKQLGKAAKISKKRYDMRVRPTKYKVGDWVFYYYPRRYTKRSFKLESLFKGPYCIIACIGTVNYRLQKSKRSKPFITHVDKIKRYYGQPPPSWLEEATTLGRETSLMEITEPELPLPASLMPLDLVERDNRETNLNQSGTDNSSLTKDVLQLDDQSEKTTIQPVEGRTPEDIELEVVSLQVRKRPRRVVGKPSRYRV